ncbi:hypothetical protein IE4803_PB00357 (plasmid) [Rhizobium etli bv. phaseoli str. IE4803]|nr:hypothetical protein IE4803_PB00357 [Rhizobium etli bv. phaseoli str. IE4803]
MVVTCIGPVGTAQRPFIGAVYPAAIPTEAVVDRLAIQQFGKFFVVFHRLSYIGYRGVYLSSDAASFQLLGC